MDADPKARRALARLLTQVSRASIAELLAREAGGGQAEAGWTIAVTGPAGVGKSTLVAALAGLRVARLRGEATPGAEMLLAVLAIDPSSPLTGGAVLGDRIRMDAIAADPGVFVRSIASAGSYGGLSRASVNLLSAVLEHGFREVIVETVGAGQSEYSAADLADTVLVVLQPDTGDFVQAMKSGIMEVADIYVLNKAHLPGAARTKAEIEEMLRYAAPASGAWQPKVVAVDDPGRLGALDAAIEAHRAALDGPALAARRARRERLWLTSMLARRVEEIIAAMPPDGDRRGRYRAVLAALSEDLAAFE